MRLIDERLDAGDGLSLLPRGPAYSAEMFELIDRYRIELREWLTWVDSTRSVADLRRYEHFAQSQFEAMSAFEYGLFEHGILVGALGLHGLDWTSRHAEIGYWLAPSAQGRGLMTRAVATLATHAFGRLELHRLEIRCVVENHRSRAVAERLGFELEGMLTEAHSLHGRFRDLALYAMVKSKWERTGL